MAAAATVSILVLVVALLVLAGFVMGIILWITGGRRSSGEMSCGGCGYNVHGLEQLHCPECGADLRAVGISKGSSGGKRTVGIVMTVLCGFVLVSCVGIMLVSFLFASASNSSTTIQTHTGPIGAPTQTAPTPPLTNTAQSEQDASDADAGDGEPE